MMHGDLGLADGIEHSHQEMLELGEYSEEAPQHPLETILRFLRRLLYRRLRCRPRRCNVVTV